MKSVESAPAKPKSTRSSNKMNLNTSLSIPFIMRTSGAMSPDTIMRVRSWRTHMSSTATEPTVSK